MRCMRWRERSTRAQILCSARRPSLSNALHSDILIHLRARTHKSTHPGCFIYLCIRLKITPAQRHDQRWERHFLLQRCLHMSRLWAMGEKEDWQLWEEGEIQTKRLVNPASRALDGWTTAGKVCGGSCLEKSGGEKKKSHSEAMIKTSSFFHCPNSSSNTFFPPLLGYKI